MPLIKIARWSEKVRPIPTDRIDENPYQPRRRFDPDEMRALVASVRRLGVVVPIIVRPTSGGRYELVSGERRWRACRELEMKKLPALVRRLSDADVLEMALVENMLRSNLSRLEEADALGRMQGEFQRMSGEVLQSEMGLTCEKQQEYAALAALPVILKQALHLKLIAPPQALVLAARVSPDGLPEWIARVSTKKLTLEQIETALPERSL